jgi:two-component system, NarL family, sensor histidine kinase DevS
LDEREKKADERDGAANRRDIVAFERDQAADEREQVADDREQVADEREGAANRRDVIAFERDQAADERELLIQERERIAMDLHDHVIQRLFGAGMRLQGRLARTDPESGERIREVVDELDAAIVDLRSTIYSLRHHDGSVGLRAEVLEIAAKASVQLDHEPRVTFHGAVDVLVLDEVAEDIVAVVREALSNVARHAGASSTQIDLIADAEVICQVTDDGVGMGSATRSSGLANLKRRAEARGGAFSVTSPLSGGTFLEWRVPL